MALSMRTVIFSLVVLVALLTIPVMIGIYVYRDSRRRGRCQTPRNERYGMDADCCGGPRSDRVYHLPAGTGELS